MRRRAAVLLLAALAAGPALPAAAPAAPVVHAHRGGALADGRPLLPENTLEAFRAAAAVPGLWLELDAVVSADGVPFVLHDSTLDRTTDCEGVVRELPATAIDRCRVDRLGVSQTLVPLPPGTVPPRIPRLADVLAFAKAAGVAGVNVEVKRIPGDPAYVPGDTSFARAVVDAVRAAALPADRVIVQSFDPSNLDVAEAELPGVQTSFLTLDGTDDGGLALAVARGYEWVSPGGVPSAAQVAAAHAAGRRVVPYTLNTAEEVRAAAAAGVDALITDDPPLARRALGLPAAAAHQRRSGQVCCVRVLPARRATVLRRGFLVARVRGDAGARGTVEVLRGTMPVARATVRLRSGATQRVRVRLTAAGRRLLRRPGTVRLTVRGGTQEGRLTLPGRVR